MSTTNEKTHIEWHETTRWRLDESVCNNKQRWSKDKCRCECKELIDKDVCDKGFVWNPSNCECECDKLCDIDEYLDYENFKCRKKLIDKLVEECTKTNNKVKIAIITLAENESKYKRSSCTLYIVLFLIIFTINIGMCIHFVYYKYMYCNKETDCKEKLYFLGNNY